MLFRSWHFQELYIHLHCNHNGGLPKCMESFTETPTLSGITAASLPIGYAGICSMGIAYSLQIVGQKHLEPTPASLIMSLESVFAALCGWLLLHEQMTTAELCGCALVFGAVIISQLPQKEKTHG